MRNLVGTRAVIVGTVVALILAAACGSKAHAKKTALVYGDSISWQASNDLARAFAGNKDWKLVNHSFPGVAPCDAVSVLAKDLAAYHPAVVTVSFVGDEFYKCMKAPDGKAWVPGSAGYFNRYRLDLNTIFRGVTKSGAKLLYVEPPPLMNNTILDQINAIATKLAGSYRGASVSSAVRTALGNRGDYAQYLPCLPTETEALGCGTDHQIEIRNSDKIHLCPVTADARTLNCSVYSSGEYRYARALSQAIFAVK